MDTSENTDPYVPKQAPEGITGGSSVIKQQCERLKPKVTALMYEEVLSYKHSFASLREYDLPP